MSSVRNIKQAKPRPRPFQIGVSVPVPEFVGWLGMPMNSVRLKIASSSQSGPGGAVCMALIKKERESFLARMLEGKASA